MVGKSWMCAGVAAVLTLGLAAGATAGAAAPAPAQHHAKSDFDGDGRNDIALGAPGSDRVRITYTHAVRDGSHVVFITGQAPHPAPMFFGVSLAVGDFNGDGYADLAVGAPDYRPRHQHGGFGNPETQGAVFEYHGSATGLHQVPLFMVGPYDGDEPYNLGDALAAGDPDRDGYSDLATNLLGSDDGNIRLYHGSAGGLTPTGMQALNDYEATTLAFGDLNGDHHSDLIAGSDVDFSNGTDIDYGDVQVFNGTALGVRQHSTLIDGQQVGVRYGFGSSGLDAGDVDGDGYEDVVAGSHYDTQHGTTKRTGSIVVLYGGPHGVRASHSQRVQAGRVYSNPHNGDQFGGDVAVADVTGDGRDDVVVGAPGKSVAGVLAAGAVYFLAGGAHGLSIAHPQTFTLATPGVPGAPHRRGSFGAAVHLAQHGGDAHLDLLAGAPKESYGGTHHGGYAARLLGTPHGLTTSHAQAAGGSARGDLLGWAVL